MLRHALPKYRRNKKQPYAFPFISHPHQGTDADASIPHCLKRIRSPGRLGRPVQFTMNLGNFATTSVVSVGMLDDRGGEVNRIVKIISPACTIRKRHAIRAFSLGCLFLLLLDPECVMAIGICSDICCTCRAAALIMPSIAAPSAVNNSSH